jgi:hypothetical protein
MAIFGLLLDLFSLPALAPILVRYEQENGKPLDIVSLPLCPLTNFFVAQEEQDEREFFITE